VSTIGVRCGPSEPATHRLRVVQRDVGIDRSDGGVDSGGELARRHNRAQRERGGRTRLLLVVPIDGLLHRRHGEAGLFHGRHDADDGVPRARRAERHALQPLAERIAAGPEFVRQVLVHDDDRLRLVRCEVAPADDGDTERRQVTFVDGAMLGVRLGTARR
jgi:hypothetical protein